MTSEVPDVGKVTNWADDVDESPAVSVAVPLPTETLPPASQSPAVFDPDIPRRPPFKAYISNISYDIQPEHIEDLFRGLQIRDVQFIVHKDTQRPKGVFVEFATGDELQNALSATGTVMLGRSIRVEVARPKDSSLGSARSGGFGSRNSGFSDYDTSRSRHGSDHLDRSLSGHSDRSLRGRDSGRSGSGFDDRSGGPFDRRRPSGGAGEDGEGRWGGRGGNPPLSRTTSVSSTRSSEHAEGDSDSTRNKSLTVQIDRTASGQPKANPFGSAKPVDAAAKLRELDERDAQRKAEEAAKRKADRDAALEAERAQREGAAGPSQDGPAPQQRGGWSRRGSRSGPDSMQSRRPVSNDGGGGPPGLQGRGSGPQGGRGSQQPHSRGGRHPPAQNWPGAVGGPQGNGQPQQQQQSALLHPSGGNGPNGGPHLKRRPSNSPTGPGPVAAGASPPATSPSTAEAASPAPAAAPASTSSGAGNVDDDGFQRQGRGSGKAWGPSARGDQPAAARPNAWAQGSSMVRAPPASSGSTDVEPPKLANAFGALNVSES